LAKALAPRLAKLAIGIVAMLPAARIAVQAFSDDLGANPIAEAENRLGFWTLTLLLATLAPTPIKVVTGWKWPLGRRRLLGVETIVYVCLHFGLYIAVDQGFDFGEIWKDIAKRKFITVGFVAFLLLVPLAITSTDAMVRRLGFPRWKRLHRSIYAAAVLGVVHFVWRVKSDYREPAIFAVALAVLFVIRVAGARGWPGSRAKKPPAGPVAQVDRAAVS
jgi:sulfoxide reductase heme-binding subunit YedZ